MNGRAMSDFHGESDVESRPSGYLLGELGSPTARAGALWLIPLTRPIHEVASCGGSSHAGGACASPAALAPSQCDDDVPVAATNRDDVPLVALGTSRATVKGSSCNRCVQGAAPSRRVRT